MEVSIPTKSLIVESSIEMLIEEIKKRPALYKKSLKEYCDTNLKKILWVEVCEAVVPSWSQLSSQDKFKQGQDLQKKWANLRTCFRRELRAQNNTKSGQAANKRRKYLYFENLLFLLPCMENPRTESNLGEDDLIEIDEDDDEFGHTTSTPPPRRRVRTNLTKKTDVDEAIIKALNATNAVDEDTNFALSLVPSLQNLTVEEKLDAKICILNIFKQIILNRRIDTNSESAYNNISTQPPSPFPMYIQVAHRPPKPLAYASSSSPSPNLS